MIPTEKGPCGGSLHVQVEFLLDIADPRPGDIGVAVITVIVLTDDSCDISSAVAAGNIELVVGADRKGLCEIRMPEFLRSVDRCARFEGRRYGIAGDDGSSRIWIPSVRLVFFVP